MNSIIVVLPKPEDGKSIRNLLSRHGYDVTAVCTQGSQVLNYIDMMNDGIIISGYKFSDMYYFDLKHSLTPGFDMLLMASQRVCGECMDHEIVCVTMPLKVQELVDKLEEISYTVDRKRRKRRMAPKQRSEEEQQAIMQAKALLMEKNSMTEEEAHRYLQKTSMDSGTNIVETAQMLLTLMSV